MGMKKDFTFHIHSLLHLREQENNNTLQRWLELVSVCNKTLEMTKLQMITQLLSSIPVLIFLKATDIYEGFLKTYAHLKPFSDHLKLMIKRGHLGLLVQRCCETNCIYLRWQKR